MASKLQFLNYHHPILFSSLPSSSPSYSLHPSPFTLTCTTHNISCFRSLRRRTNGKIRRNNKTFGGISATLQPLDLTEDNVNQVLDDARTKFAQIFDTELGMTGQAELAELDGPFVKIRLRGRFWHERSMVLARLGTYLKQRIPEILEVDIEDEKQLDDSPENF